MSTLHCLYSKKIEGMNIRKIQEEASENQFHHLSTLLNYLCFYLERTNGQFYQQATNK